VRLVKARSLCVVYDGELEIVVNGEIKGFAGRMSILVELHWKRKGK